MSRAFNPAAWTDGVTIVHVADYQAIATDLYTRGDNVDGGGYGRANTGFLGLIPGALPGTTYTVSAAAWSGGTATVTIGGHVIGVGQLVTISGVTPSAWNFGPVRVTAVTGTTFSFAVAANPGTYTSGGSVLVGSVPGYGTIAANANNQLQIYTGSSWAAATTAVAAGVWWSGSGGPGGGLGSNGDMYLNAANGDVYGPKTGGSWGSVVGNIIGPTGGAGPSYRATSSTSLTIGTGSKSFTTQAGTAYSAGARVRAASAGSPGNYMEGVISSYSGTTLVVNVDHVGGSGTFTDWNFNAAGDVGASGAGSGDMLVATYDPANVAGQLLKDSGVDGLLARNGAGVATQAKADHVSAPVYAADTSGAANTITATLSPAISAYAAGVRYRVKVANANTGATTVNLNALGAKTIRKWSGGALVDLVAGDVVAGQMVDLTYDGTYMQIGAVTTTEAWTAVTFQHSWSNLGSGWQTAAYMRVPLPNGGYLVRIRGAVQPGTSTDGTIIFTLPAGFRPTADEIFAANQNYGGSDKSCRIDVIAASGNVLIYGYTGGYVSLSQISFLTF